VADTILLTHEELLKKCKVALGLQGADDNVTAALELTLQTAEGLILGAGVIEQVLYLPNRAGAVAMVVNDLWNNAPGDVTLSAGSIMFISQMELQSLVILEEASTE
jgi:hypothetical protein